MIKTYSFKQRLPLVIEPEQPCKLQDLLNLLQQDNGFFRKELLSSGGILLRNFPIQDIDAFAAVIEALNLGSSVDYIGGDSPRNKIKGGIYTSTEAPPSIKIPLHNELSFVKHYPKHIYFYCSVAPAEKGETIIADARKVYESMDPAVRDRFMERGLKYVSCYYGKSRLMELMNKFQRSHKPWKDVFETTDKKEAEEKCRKAEFEYKWHKDWIRISQTRPSVMAHPETGETVWFNQAHLYDFSPKLLGLWRYLGAKAFYCRPHTRLHEIFYADGERIPREDLYHVMDTLDANTIHFPWQKHDLLILDNVLAMHGRATFSGPRRIYTAMTS